MYAKVVATHPVAHKSQLMKSPAEYLLGGAFSMPRMWA